MAGNLFQASNQINLEAARVAFHAAFMQQLEAMGEDPINALYAEVSSSSSIEEWDWLGDLPGFEEWKGDRKLGDVSAFKMQIANRDWANGFRVHQNNFKDDKLGLFPIRVAGLAQKGMRHRSDLMVKMMLNGFAGNVFPQTGNGLAYDGAFFFSDSHASDGGPNQSNKISGGALTVANLELAEQKLKNMTTADGQDPLEIGGTHLIVGPALEFVAKKLMGAEVIANAAGTAADTNIHRDQYKVIVSRRIRGSQANNWFLADLSQPIKPFIFQLREAISTSAILGNQGGQGDSESRFARGEYKFGAEARYNVGAFAWQTIVGSNA
jgi:phage major head subunit gpT-like protein